MEGFGMTVTQLGATIVADNPPQCDGLNYHQVLARIPGMTYRQLDFWVRTGRLKCHHHLGSSRAIDPWGGSGTERCWPPDQVTIAARIYKLLTRGIRDVDTALAIATNRHVLLELMSELTKIEAEQVGA